MNRKQRRAGRKSASVAMPPAQPADPVDLHMLGIAAYRAGDHGTAAELIARAIAIDARIPAFHYNLAIVLKALGRLGDAAASYERAIALQPDHVNAHNNLGNIWRMAGRPDLATASFARALRFNPDNADTHFSLGLLCSDSGEKDAAEGHFRRSLACDAADRNGAAILLAHMGKGEVPARTPEAQLLSVYDLRAGFWDREDTYFGARLVGEGLARHAGNAKLDMLDIGCGTGLVGVVVRALARRLDGVDISPAMLDKAKAKAVYDGLFQADLGTFMLQHDSGYDVLLAAATLIHFGDLKPLFAAASRCLRDQGLFVFTFFPHEAGDYAVASSARLAQSGCFSHSPSYVERMAAETGFAILELQKAIHEHDQDGKPLCGMLAVLRVAR